MTSLSSTCTAEPKVGADSVLDIAGGFWLSHAVLPASVFLGLVGVLGALELDARVADAFFDPSRGAFRARDAWWANELLHSGGRDVVALLGIAALAVVGLGWAGRFRPALARFRPALRPALYFVLCLSFSTGAVSLLKHHIHRDCPWDMERWGGSRPYFELFEARPASLPASGCFPGGHSSGGFALLALYFLGRERGAGWARLGLLLGVGVGTTFAFAQWARGAHFPSHDLWSAAVCWAFALVLYAGVFRRRLWSPS